MNKSLIHQAKPIDVTRLDGQVERVMVNRLSVLDLYTVVELLEGTRTPELITLCTGRPREWLAGLSDASYGDLAKACVEENFLRAMELAAKDSAIAAKVLPLAGRIETAAAQALGLMSSASAAVSPRSPGGPGASASGTPSSSSSPSSASTGGGAPETA